MQPDVLHDAPRPPYSPADREAAYRVYRTGARRSLRKTAELTGIPDGTLFHWSRTEDWHQRRKANDGRDRAAMRDHAELACSASTPSSSTAPTTSP